jgi:hypothetical protein
MTPLQANKSFWGIQPKMDWLSIDTRFAFAYGWAARSLCHLAMPVADDAHLPCRKTN